MVPKNLTKTRSQFCTQVNLKSNLLGSIFGTRWEPSLSSSIQITGTILRVHFQGCLKTRIKLILFFKCNLSSIFKAFGFIFYFVVLCLLLIFIMIFLFKLLGFSCLLKTSCINFKQTSNC